MKVLITKASNDSWYYHKVVEVEYAYDISIINIGVYS